MSPVPTIALAGDPSITNSEDGPANFRPRPITLIGYQGLKARGIAYSRSHLWRLETACRFPRRVHVGKGRVAWVEHEVDDYLAGLAAARDTSPSVEAASTREPAKGQPSPSATCKRRAA
jgi:prophage regulatory protein